jgi:energy-coupling factor transporter transmembrane protein EcfT
MQELGINRDQWLAIFVPGLVTIALFTIGSFPFRPYVIAFAFGWLLAWCFMFFVWLRAKWEANYQQSVEKSQ